MSQSNGNKWVVLIAFALVALTNQMLWLNFSPLVTFVMSTYQVDEMTASLLMLIFPVMYVLFSVHAGGRIDKLGYKKVISYGSILMTIGAALRILHANFWMVFAGQALIAVAQPYIINGISKLVADWFEEKDAASATGLGTVGMFLGMALGAAITPMIVGDGSGYTNMLMIMAGISLATTLFFIFAVKENKQSNDVTSTGTWKDFASLLKNKNIVIINIISFIALGFFNGLTGWIEPILGERGITKEDAGMVAGVVIFGGILGAAIVPVISDKTKRRKPYILLSAILATALAYPLMTGSDIGLLLALGGAIGFLFLPGYPLLMAASEEEAGKAKAGASTGLLMFSGNFGGIVTIMGMQFIKGDGPTWMPAIYFCVGLIAIAIPFALMMKETFHRRGA